MKVLRIFAPAKINLCLDILKKSSNGYHKIQTILQTVDSLRDTITIKASREKDILSIVKGPKKLPIQNPESTLPFKALRIIKMYCKVKKFVEIKIEKNIPLSSGLGGFSSDSAAILKGLNQFWALQLREKQLIILAIKLGMDVPFFINGDTALATNYGEKLTPLKPLKGLKFEIKTHSSSSDQNKTKNAYRQLDLKNCAQNLHKTKKLLQAIEASDNQQIIQNLHNDFETIYPTKKDQHLSGSGPSIFMAGII